MKLKSISLLLLLAGLSCLSMRAKDNPDTARTAIRDLMTVEGVRENPLIGYGMVVGLAGTGDRQQTMFTTQTLGNILQKMGVTIPVKSVSVKNVASVFVTASLPPFSRPGTQIDVTVSSIGDATSLAGGTLLLTTLYAADGQVYGEAQGALTLGGYTAGKGGNSKQVNHPTAGRIPNGGLVERDVAVDLSKQKVIALALRDTDFRVTHDVADAINAEMGRPIANAVDGRRVELQASAEPNVPALLARVMAVKVETHPRAKVVVNEKTGTIVMGQDVRLSAVSILHGDLSIDIATQYQVSQPAPFSNRGNTEVVPQTAVESKDEPVRKIELTEGAKVEQLVHGLQAIGASARDVVAILEAIKAAGALDADLEVI
ncbi:MAG: flagellar basal body P-ring protein FlgI [Candidatus Korobacteraceae bacterium]